MTPTWASVDVGEPTIGILPSGICAYVAPTWAEGVEIIFETSVPKLTMKPATAARWVAGV